MNAPFQQKLAHIATVPGSNCKGSNTFLRSARQRRRAFAKTMDKMIATAVKKHHAATPEDMPPAALARLTQDIKDLRLSYCGV